MWILNLFLLSGFLCQCNGDEFRDEDYVHRIDYGFNINKKSNQLSLSPRISSIISERETEPNRPPYPSAYYWNKEEYPNPITEPFACKQTKSSLLCDPDQLLNATETEQLQLELNQYKTSKQCFCKICPPKQAGIKIAIALAKNIYIGYNDINNEAIQSFADHLQNRWRFSVCGDSILILLVQSYLPHQSTLATSMGHVAERIFSGEKFFQRLIYNNNNNNNNENENETKNKKTYGTKEFDDEAKDSASFTYTGNGNGNGKGLGQNFQLLKSMLVAINDYVNNFDNILLNNETISMLTLNSNENIATDAILTSQHSDTRYTALIVLGTIIGFILFLTIIISGIILLKRHYEKEHPVSNSDNDNRQSLSMNADGYIPANIDEPEQPVPEEEQQQSVQEEQFKTDAANELDNGQGR